MNEQEQIAQLRREQEAVDVLRNKLGFSSPGAAIFLGPYGANANDSVVVEADGFGGARVCIVEGNYPVDFVTKFEKQFETEAGATSVAEDLTEGRSASSVFDPVC